LLPYVVVVVAVLRLVHVFLYCFSVQAGLNGHK